MYVILTAHKVNFIMIHLKHVHVHQVNIGMEIFVFYVMVVKLGIQLLKIVNVHQEIFGMDKIVMIHVMEEESWILLLNNVFVHQEIGMEILVLYVLILKFGVSQD